MHLLCNYMDTFALYQRCPFIAGATLHNVTLGCRSTLRMLVCVMCRRFVHRNKAETWCKLMISVYKVRKIVIISLVVSVCTSK